MPKSYPSSLIIVNSAMLRSHISAKAVVLKYFSILWHAWDTSSGILTRLWRSFGFLLLAWYRQTIVYHRQGGASHVLHLSGSRRSMVRPRLTFSNIGTLAQWRELLSTRKPGFFSLLGADVVMAQNWSDLICHQVQKSLVLSASPVLRCTCFSLEMS